MERKGKAGWKRGKEEVCGVEVEVEMEGGRERRGANGVAGCGCYYSFANSFSTLLTYLHLNLFYQKPDTPCCV